MNLSKTIAKVKREAGGYSLAFLVLFLLINIMNFLAFNNTLNTNIEILSSALSQTAHNFSSTNSVNLNIFDSKNRNQNALKEKIDIAYSLSKNLKNLGPFYNARVSFKPSSTNYFFAETLEQRTPTIIFSNIFSNHLNSKEETIHDIFELKLMFKEANSSFMNFDNFCYITQSEANHIISQNSVLHSYSDLIGFSLPLKFVNDGVETLIYWKISNIILNEEGIDSFLKNTYGSYILAYVSLPSFENLSLDFDFGMSDITNFNKIKELQSIFPVEGNTYMINTINMPNIERNALEKIVSLFKINYLDKRSVLTTVTIVCSFVIMFLYIGSYSILITRNKIKLNKTLSCYFISIFFLVYYFFKFLFTINIEFAKFFSTGSILSNLIFLIVMVVLVTTNNIHIKRKGIILNL